MHIALYDSAGADVVQLDATVARDDGPRGLALRFLETSPNIDARLRDFISRLPAIHALQPRPARLLFSLAPMAHSSYRRCLSFPPAPG